MIAPQNCVSHVNGAVDCGKDDQQGKSGKEKNEKAKRNKRID